MIAAIDYHIRLSRNGYVSQAGTRQIVIELYQQGIRRVVNTRLGIEPEHFAYGRVQPSCPEYDLLNRRIRRTLRHLMELEDEMVDAGFEPSPQRVIDAYRNNLSRSVTLEEWVESVIMTSDRRQTTKGNYKSMLRSLHDFQSGLRLTDLTYDLILRWQHWMHTCRHLAPNTVTLRLKTLRCLVNEAIRRDVIHSDNDPFRRIRIPEITARREHLTADELLQLEVLPLNTTPRLAHVRDAFLFCCYTGLRWSDFSALSSAQLSNSVLTLRQQKTNRPLIIPLAALFAGKPLAILNRYGTPERLAAIGDSHHANRQLRKLALRAGITKHLHWHMSRHTCGTLLNQHGLLMQEIQYILGHQKQSTTEKHYAETLLPQVTQSLLRAFGDTKETVLQYDTGARRSRWAVSDAQGG